MDLGQTFHLFAAEGATKIGEPIDWVEAQRVEWVRAGDLRDELSAGRVGDGLSVTALCWALAFGIVT